jgi:hypothetical protein
MPNDSANSVKRPGNLSVCDKLNNLSTSFLSYL